MDSRPGPSLDFKRTALGLGAPDATPSPYPAPPPPAPVAKEAEIATAAAPAVSTASTPAAPAPELPKRPVVVDWGTTLIGGAGEAAAGKPRGLGRDGAGKPPLDWDDDAKTTVMAPWPGASQSGALPSFALPDQSPPPGRAGYYPFESGPPPAMTLGMGSAATTTARRRGRSKTARVLAFVTLASAAALVAVVFALRFQKGRIVVDASTEDGQRPNTAEVFVDGHKVCDVVPCAVPGVSPGPRIIQVVAPGFVAPEPSAEPVQAGKATTIVVPLASAPDHTGLAAGGDLPGVELVVDGVRRGTLPVRVTGLSPGSHRVRFEGDRYEASERTVEVSAGQVRDLGAPSLRVVRGLVTVEVATPGARVVLVRERDGARKALRGPFPMRIEIEGNERWKVVATRRGARTFEAGVDFSDGRAVKSVRVE